jgi:D-glycero-beta-D-manno-heptose 1-phosphate adenylyltransferase
MSLFQKNRESKLIAPEHLKERILKIRSEGKTIATLNGSFDLLHAGHLEILFQAACQADLLIVALNTDASIEKYKVKQPIIPLKYRLQLISALEMVDFVTWFEETDPRELLKIIKPDVHVNGSEYGENCIEAQVVKENGGKIYIVDRIPGLATSEIVKKIQERLTIGL